MCEHIFELCPTDIVLGNQWCPFCSNQKLCDDEDCTKCHNKSFASHIKAKYWSPKNKLKPRKIFKYTNHKYLFNCHICHHEFELQLSSISRDDYWCYYCSSRKKQLCSNESCEHCYNNSFASHEKAKFWSSKNTLKQRDIIKNSCEKFLFNCDICNNEFKISPLKIVTRNQWCSICVNKTESKLYDF